LGHKPRGFWFDPESEVGSVEGDAPGTVGGWMRVLMKSRGRLTGLSSIYAFISFGLSQRKKTKFWISTWACFLRYKQAFLLIFKRFFYIISLKEFFNQFLNLTFFNYFELRSKIVFLIILNFVQKLSL
jgi:hypothetical protein